MGFRKSVRLTVYIINVQHVYYRIQFCIYITGFRRSQKGIYYICYNLFIVNAILTCKTTCDHYNPDENFESTLSYVLANGELVNEILYSNFCSDDALAQE